MKPLWSGKRSTRGWHPLSLSVTPSPRLFQYSTPFYLSIFMSFLGPQCSPTTRVGSDTPVPKRVFLTSKSFPLPLTTRSSGSTSALSHSGAPCNLL